MKRKDEDKAGAAGGSVELPRRAFPTVKIPELFWDVDSIGQ